MQKQKQGISLVTGALVILFGIGSYFGVASIYQSLNPASIPVVLGDDNEDKDEEEDEKDEEEDEKDNDEDKDTDDKKKEDEKKKSEKAREDAKKQAERTREMNKKSAEQASRGGDDSDENDTEDPNDDENDDTFEVEGEDEFENDDNNGGKSEDSSGMYKEKDETLEKLRKEISEAEKHIMEQGKEGGDVSGALAKLAAMKLGIDQVGISFDANNFEAAKLLAKQIKKAAHFAEKDAEDAKHVSEELMKVEKRFGQVTQKITSYEALGGDASAFKAKLASLRTDFTVLKGSSSVIARDDVKIFEDQVKRLKNSIETAIFALGGTEDDDDLFEDHEDDADDLDDDLNDVADIEDGDDNGVSKKLRKVASEHKSSVATVATALGDIKSRDGLARTLFGPDFNALDQLNTEVASMNTRAVAIESAAAQIVDPEMKQILLNQATTLRSEVTKLQSYITAEDSQFSLLGSLLKWFR